MEDECMRAAREAVDAGIGARDEEDLVAIVARAIRAADLRGYQRGTAEHDAELEAARAVVGAARSHASTSMCAAGRLLDALKAYDAAKAGKAVE